MATRTRPRAKRRSPGRPAHRRAEGRGATKFELRTAAVLDAMLGDLGRETPFQRAAERARPDLVEALQDQMLSSARQGFRDGASDPELRPPGYIRPEVAKAEAVPIPDIGDAGNFRVIAATHAAAVGQTSTLITNMEARHQETIRRLVGRSFAPDPTTGLPLTVDQLAKEIDEALARGFSDWGLTAQQASAVERAQHARLKGLLDKGMNLEDAQRHLGSWREVEIARHRKYRAKVIARTEIMTASNLGRGAGVGEAVAQGLVDPNARRKWSATGGQRMCPICTDMHGTITTLQDAWPAGEPPAHPQCRCTWTLLPPADKEERERRSESQPDAGSAALDAGRRALLIEYAEGRLRARAIREARWRVARLWRRRLGGESGLIGTRLPPGPIDILAARRVSGPKPPDLDLDVPAPRPGDQGFQGVDLRSLAPDKGLTDDEFATTLGQIMPGVPEGQARAVAQEISPHAREAMARTWDDLASRYPELAVQIDELATPGLIADFVDPADRLKMERAHAWSRWRPGGGGFGVNPTQGFAEDTLDDLRRLLDDEYGDEVSSSWFAGEGKYRYGQDQGFRDNAWAAMISHEWGHQLAYRAYENLLDVDLITDGTAARWAASEALDLRLSAAVRRGDVRAPLSGAHHFVGDELRVSWEAYADEISGYAAVNVDEFSAESFNAVYLYGDDAPDIAKWWVREMNDLAIDGPVRAVDDGGGSRRQRASGHTADAQTPRRINVRRSGARAVLAESPPGDIRDG